jgi:RNA polymerase sigma factor (sigma-70 family)
MALPKALRRKVDHSDLVQECQMDAAANISQFRGQKAPEFHAWLNGILVRRVAEAIRFWGRKRRKHSLETPLPSVGVPGNEPAGSSRSILDGLCGTEDRQGVANALERVFTWASDEDRAVIVMRHLQDRTHEEIAGRLGISPDAARKRYCRAIGRARDTAKLLALLDDHGIKGRQQEAVLLHRIRGLRPKQVVEQLALTDELFTAWIMEAQPYFREVERTRDERRTAG